MSDERPPHDEIDLLTIREVADLLRVHTRTIERLVFRGQLPVLKFGTGKSAIRFHRRDVVAYVQANTRYGTRADEAADA